VETISPTGQLLDPSRAGASNLELPKSDLDTSSMPMPVELIALVDNGGIDLASLFPQQSVPVFTTDIQGDTPYGECLVQGAYL
jgi:hypothetical protein